MAPSKTDVVKVQSRSKSWLKAFQLLAGTGLLTVVATYFLQNREAQQLERELSQSKQELAALQRKYDDLLAEKAQASTRKTSVQLDILENQIKKDFERKKKRTPVVEIMGINATGPLHQGRELFVKTLNNGGKIRFLLLDPQAKTFSDRSVLEEDTVGRIAAEELASFYILTDISTHLDEASRRNLEIRILDEPLDRSLIMVDVDADDGIIMENPYPKEPGSRGLTGEMFVWHKTGKDARGFTDNFQYFRRLWDRATPVKLKGSTFQLDAWPYRK